MQPPFEPKKSGSRVTAFELEFRGTKVKWHPDGVYFTVGNHTQFIKVQPDEPTTLIDEKAQQHG
jgi:hypothetical protein